MSSKVLMNPSPMASPVVLKQILEKSSLIQEKPKLLISSLPLKGVSNCFELFGEIEFTERPQHPSTVEDDDDNIVVAIQGTIEEDGSSKTNKDTGIQEQQGCCSAWGSSSSSSSYTMNYADARTRGSRGAFPPSISTIGRDGKPWLYLKPHRTDGRFLLQVAVVPSHKCLQATRGHGRLLLHLSNSNRHVSGNQDDAMVEIHSGSNSEMILNWRTGTLDVNC